MNLSKLNLNLDYRSSSNNLVLEFYKPCLENSIFYKRAVGFFTSNSLELLAESLKHFLFNTGQIQLIASPRLTENDIEAMKKGYEQQEPIIEKVLLEEISNIKEKSALEILSFLISINRLEIKIALTKDLHKYGIYHEKIGIFEDDKKNVVAFTGSANETYGGLISNFESIDVFCSWKKSDEYRVKNKVELFNNLFTNKTKNLSVINFPEAVKKKILEYLPTEKKINKLFLSQFKKLNETNIVAIPNNIKIREYQKTAIQNWFKNNGKGILKMATGTGKTITSLVCFIKLYENTKNIILVIVCPYQHLVDQWNDECKKFGLQPLLCYRQKKFWFSSLKDKIFIIKNKLSDVETIIVTNTTFLDKDFQEQIRRVNKTMFIADEVHNFGSKNLLKKLPKNFIYRLGLSATPERWLDEPGTEKLKEYFGDIIFRYDLKEAIKSKFLTSYYYYPILVELTPEETEEYFELTKKIQKAFLFNNNDEESEENDLLKKLLIKRSRLLANAKNKIVKLEELFKKNKNRFFNLVYCGDGSNLDEDDTTMIRQVEQVVKLLGKKLKYKVSPYTSRENIEERKRITKEYKIKNLEVLVAIRCLDEGVDIPAIQNAYILASSTNPRQFIQRRGRILRKSPEKKYAYIYDFVIIPPSYKNVKDIDDETFNIERKLLKKELTRFLEFSKIAVNGAQAKQKIINIIAQYNLLNL